MEAVRVPIEKVRMKQNQERAIHCHGCGNGSIPTPDTGDCIMCGHPNDNVAQVIDGNDECRQCKAFVVNWNMEAMRRHVSDTEKGRV